MTSTTSPPGCRISSGRAKWLVMAWVSTASRNVCRPELQRRLPHRLVPLHRRRAPDVVDEHVEGALLGVDALDQPADGVGDEVVDRHGDRPTAGRRRRGRRSPRSSPAASSPTVPTRSSAPCSRQLRRPRRAARRCPARRRAWRRRPARPCLPVTAPCPSSLVVTGVQSFASDDCRVGRVTRQVELDSYADAGVLVAVEPRQRAGGRARPRQGERDDRAAARRSSASWPSTRRRWARLDDRDVPGFIALARQLHGRLRRAVQPDDVDAAASDDQRDARRSPGPPAPRQGAGRWRLHHHPVDADLVPMCTSICAEALARMVGAGPRTIGSARARAPSAIGSSSTCRRTPAGAFCSTTCQNRVKAAAFRRRRLDGALNNAGRKLDGRCPAKVRDPRG